MSCTGCKSIFQSREILVCCTDCMRYFCPNCIERDVTQCSTCAILSERLIKPSTLKTLETTDMFAYLRCREVFTHNITTREELYKEMLLHVGTPPPQRVVSESQDYNLYESDMESDELLHLFGLHVTPIDVNTLRSSLASAPYFWDLESVSFGSVKPAMNNREVVSNSGATFFASALGDNAAKKLTRKSSTSFNMSTHPLKVTSSGEETDHETDLDEKMDLEGAFIQTCN